MSVENFYGLEGLDGVGKTTTRETLKEKGHIVLKTPPDSFPISRKRYDNLGVNSRFLFYLAGVVWAGDEAKKIVKTKRVICDRYLLTTVSAHEAMGLHPVILKSASALMKKIPVPENTFLLIVSDEERLRRLNERGSNDVDVANLKINDKILSGYRKWAKKLEHQLTEIDTTNMTPNQVVECIEDNIFSK